jgi:hypothetical protein
MAKIWSVAVVGCGIGRSHLAERYAPHPRRDLAAHPKYHDWRRVLERLQQSTTR